MVRALLVCLLLAAAARAQPAEYLEALVRAQKEEGNRLPGEPRDAPLDRAYLLYGEAVSLAPERWEAYELRGLNRCFKTMVVRSMLESTIDAMRAQGSSREELAVTRRNGENFIEICLRDAHAGFLKMEKRMRDAGRWDPDHILLASASMKFANAEHLEAADGSTGSIDDFRKLMRRGFQPDLCARMIARAYNELGAMEFENERYLQAQEYWDKGLRFARDPRIRRLILTNKAGAFEMDNEFGLAEKVLREQLETEAHVPSHWKNLGLLLGYEARYREAVLAYAKCRELCRKARAPFFLGLLHGNAWLRPAMIHGKLLEADGDLMQAWRLFLEYRSLFGDDYNFSVAFGEFAMHMGAYDIAYPYLVHAKNLQPFCPMPYQLLLTVAGRTSGNADEIRERVKAAQKDFREARLRFQSREETAQLKRICGGMRDVADGAPLPGKQVTRLDPDPLKGADPDVLPGWLEGVAAKRKPYRPFDPEIDKAQRDLRVDPEPGAKQPESRTDAVPAEASAGGTMAWILGAGALVLLAGGALVILRRRRREA